MVRTADASCNDDVISGSVGHWQAYRDTLVSLLHRRVRELEQLDRVVLAAAGEDLQVRVRVEVDAGHLLQ